MVVYISLIKKSHRIFKISPPPKRKVAILAGMNFSGYRDGPCGEALFNSPSGLTVDPVSGDLFVADYGNHRIRRINPVTQMVTSFAGNGTHGDHNGPSNSACFNNPSGVAYDSQRESLFVTDENHKLKQVNIRTGEVTTIVGVGSAGYKDGAAAMFNYPHGVAVDSLGTIFIADTYNHRIRKVIYWSAIDGEVLFGD